jgi:hypothetical protein
MDNLDKLIDDLSKPIFVYRMAAPQWHYDDERSLSMKKSAATRRENARNKISELVFDYVADHQARIRR